MLQLFGALSFLHSRHVLYRDLKLSNLLYNHRGELRVADFGLARRVGAEYVGFDCGASNEKNCFLTPNVVSLWYRPPELLFDSKYYDMGVGMSCKIYCEYIFLRVKMISHETLVFTLILYKTTGERDVQWANFCSENR